MGIISRFADVMEANINALLDKCEDPLKMVDQSLRKCNEELAEVKKETAAIMAEEKRDKRRVDEIQEEIRKYEDSARKAIQSGNDEDARTLLAKKQELERIKAIVDNTYEAAKANSDKMQQMYSKLTSDIITLNNRRETIKTQIAMAKAQDRVTKASSTVSKLNTTDTLSRMESKAQKILDESTARAELSQSQIQITKDAATLLADKYTLGTDKAVDDELAAMKAEMEIE